MILGAHRPADILLTGHVCDLQCALPPSLQSGHSVVAEVSPDIHICGVCKQQYNNFEVFLSHKQNGCSLPTSDSPVVTADAPLTGLKKIKIIHLIAGRWLQCHCLLSASLCLSFPPPRPDPAAEFVFEESYQTCVVKGARKILPRVPKTPSKKLKPALTSKRHVCCFSGQGPL